MKTNRRFRQVILLITALALIMSCGNTDQQDPVDTSDVDPIESLADAFILADSASMAMVSCTYGFRVYGTGAYSDSPVLVGNLSGKILDDGLILIAIQAEQEIDPASAESAEIGSFVIGVDSAYALDLMEETFHRGSIDNGGRDLIRPVNYSVMNEYFLDGPFTDEINSTIAYEGTEAVGDIECGVYLVTYPGGQESRWLLGIQDNLPRQVERINQDAEGNISSVVLEVSDLEVNADIPDSFFRLDPPEGMEVIEYSSFLTKGAPAPQWTLLDSGGNSVSLAELRGNVVVLDFWATWCGPCKEVMPQIQAISEAYADDPVLVYGVNVWESDDAAAFMAENGYTYGLLLNGDEVGAEYLVTGIPTLYVIDQEGNVAFCEVGSSPVLGEILTEVIDNLL